MKRGGESSKPTAYAIHCHGNYGDKCNQGGLVFLTKDEYIRQMRQPDNVWRCPRCGSTANWSDENYEERQ